MNTAQAKVLQYDADGDGKLDENEIAALMAGGDFDADGDGQLDASEVAALLSAVQSIAPPGQPAAAPAPPAPPAPPTEMRSDLVKETILPMKPAGPISGLLRPLNEPLILSLGGLFSPTTPFAEPPLPLPVRSNVAFPPAPADMSARHPDISTPRQEPEPTPS